MLFKEFLPKILCFTLNYFYVICYIIASYQRDFRQTINKNKFVSKQSTSAMSREVCARYVLGNCPHGYRGNKLVNGLQCGFAHPTLCKYYNVWPAGCEKTQTCKFFHPKLCDRSMKERICLNELCTLAHVKGTRRNLFGESGFDFNARYTNDEDRVSREEFLNLKRMIQDLPACLESRMEKVFQRDPCDNTVCKQMIGDLTVRFDQDMKEVKQLVRDFSSRFEIKTKKISETRCEDNATCKQMMLDLSEPFENEINKVSQSRSMHNCLQTATRGFNLLLNSSLQQRLSCFCICFCYFYVSTKMYDKYFFSSSGIYTSYKRFID